MQEKTFTLMFTDVEASTSLATQKGDVEGRAVPARHRDVVRSQLAEYGGREIDSAGDAFFVALRVYQVKEERSLSIAIAEDNLLVREGVMSVLDLYNDMRVVATCGDLASIRGAINKQVPDVVVTDIRMPPTGTDEGLQLAEWLGRSHPSVAVVALSQYVDEVYVRRLLSSGPGGRAFLLKETVGDRHALCEAIKTVAAGGTYLDPELDVATYTARVKDAP